MKRYILFRGGAYYPEGGWADFGGFFDTADDAMAAYRLWCAKVREDHSVLEGDNWAHLVDTQNGFIYGGKHSGSNEWVWTDDYWPEEEAGCST